MSQSQLHSGQGEITHQEHPLGIYFKIWLLLFFLSACSYMVDYLNFQGTLRWTLIIVFMLLKAGFIITVFMHMVWERMALATAIILPPFVLVLLLGFMSFEADYTNSTRVDYMGEENIPQFSFHHDATHTESSIESAIESAIENSPVQAH